MTDRLTLLEEAANVREKARQVRELCDDMRRADREHWVAFRVATEDAEGFASEALRRSWAALTAIERMIEAHKRTRDIPKDVQ